MTTVNDFIDILRIIREQPEWADALRSALLSQELLEMPHTLAEFAKAADQRLTALEGSVSELQGLAKSADQRLTTLEGDVAELKDGQARLERSFSRLEGDFGNRKGDTYELKVGNNIFSIVGQQLDIIPVRVLKGSRAPNDMAFLNPIYEARRKGIITERERFDAFGVDLVLEGRIESEQPTVYVVMEVSRTVGDYDINRAAERAEIVQRVTGKQALPSVVGVYIDDAHRRLAQECNVTPIAYGE